MDAIALVYVVDDMASVRTLVTALLERAGHAVVAFADGGACQAALATQVPDVVFLDMVVGAESGIAIAQQIHGRYPLLPIYMLTGYTAEDAAAQADLVAQAHVQGWVSKPIAPGALEKIVADVLVRGAA
jgi:CheY-like chemotaxis protein